MDQLPPVIQLMDSGGNPLVVSASPIAAGDAQPNPFAGAVATESWNSGTATDDIAVGQDDQYFNELKLGVEPAGTVDIQLGASESTALGEQPTRVRARQPKKKKSSIGTMIGVALGPVLALPLAGGILLALGRAPDLGFWPFDGSYNGGSPKRSAAPPLDSNASTKPKGGYFPQTPRTLPSSGSLLDDGSDVAEAVKAITGGDELQLADDSATLPESSDDNMNDLAAADLELPELSDVLNITDLPDDMTELPDDPAELVEMPISEPADPNLVKPPVTPADNAVATVDHVEPQIAMPPEDAAVPDPPGDTIPPELQVPEPNVSETELKLPQLPTELTQPADSPELTGAIAEALGSIQKLTEMRKQSTDTKRDYGLTYVDISAVASKDVSVGSQAVADLMNQLASSPALEDLGAIGPRWWGYTTRTHDGMLLVGTLTDGQIIKLKGLDDAADVPVSFPAGIQVPEAERVMAFGRIQGTGDNRVVVISAIQPLP